MSADPATMAMKVMIEPRASVDAAYLADGEWQVEIAGTLYPALVSARPLYDPGMTRIRA